MIGYGRWISTRLRERQREYRARREPALLSLVTPVYDTPPHFLRALTRSLFAQDYPWFEWVIVDNGCTQPGTRHLLARIARDPRVTLLRLECNRGIMAGTRHAVAHARGRYVLPVDSDDTLYPDALRVMAAVLQDKGYPALAYSDEDKLLPSGKADHPFLKPDWDPVLFFNCCYVAHLCAIDRSLAKDVGAYTDDAAHGCHDWDTFWRFVRAGYEPVHVPEVLYSWRMHAGSTATPDAAPKPYTIACQHYVLTDRVRALELEDQIEMRTNPLFHGVGMWHAARRQVQPLPMHVLLLRRPQPGPGAPGAGFGGRGHWRRCMRALAESNYPCLNIHLLGQGIADHTSEVESWTQMPGSPGLHLDTLRADNLFDPAVVELLTALPADAPVVLFSEDVVPLTLDWPWETLGLFELHPDAAVVGGRILDQTGKTESAGEIFGVDGFLGSPERGRHDGEMGHYGLYISQRCVDAVSAELCAVRAGFLRSALAHPRPPGDLRMLSARLAGLARQQRVRVIYSPHIAAQRVESKPGPLGAGFGDIELTAIAQFRAEFGDLQRDDRHYSRHYSRDSQRAYHLRSVTSAPACSSTRAPVPA